VSDAADAPDDSALLDRVDADLGAVDDALRRLDDGTYGSCQVCGTRLDPASLAANPLLTLCPSHQS
jgi:RNA polymerase-binding transcription factor DksA